MTTHDDQTLILEPIPRTPHTDALTATPGDVTRAIGAVLHFTAQRRTTSEIAALVLELIEETWPDVTAHLWVVRSVETCSHCPIPEHCASQIHCLRRESSARASDCPAVPYGRGIVGRLAIQRRSIVNSRWDESPEAFERAFSAAHDLRYFSGYPLIAADRFFGVLGVSSTHALAPECTTMLDLFVQATAHGIGMSELLEEGDAHSAHLESRVAQKTLELREQVSDMDAIRKGLMNMMSDAYEAHRRLQDLAKSLEERVEDQTREAIAAKDEALRANALKSEFLSQVSHELRTPMHGIISYAKVGLRKIDKSSVEKNREFFTQILESAQELLALINDLLDLSKIEAGRGQYEFELQDIGAQVRRLIVFYEPLMKEHGIAFDLDTSALTDPMAVFDRNHMHQVLTNLLGNAMKFSPKGAKVFLRVANAADQIVVEIADQGPGIPEGELQNIFEAFVQGSHARTGKKTGTGLGLAIARGIVRDHGGELTAANRPTTGASFTFHFPACGPSSPPNRR